MSVFSTFSNDSVSFLMAVWSRVGSSYWKEERMVKGESTALVFVSFGGAHIDCDEWLWRCCDVGGEQCCQVEWFVMIVEGIENFDRKLNLRMFQ